jgi:type IV secretory pathway TrbF-like protein
LSAVVGFLSFVAMIVISAMVGGAVFQSFWTWFVVPIFNWPTLGLAQALGLLATTRLAAMSVSHADTAKRTWDDHVTRWLAMLVVYLIIWLTGWIIKGFL